MPDTPESKRQACDIPPGRRAGLGRLFVIGLVAAAGIAAVAMWWHREALGDGLVDLWEIIKDKELFREKVESFGGWAPVVFILFQISQVIFAPLPGELFGAAGGYVFGWPPALLYSTIGLTVGSLANFFLARVIGREFVERIISPAHLERFHRLMEHQGLIVSFILFIIPGFPKDYLCLFLGLTPMNWRVFLFICGVGRIPGTFVLSLQGALVYEQNYMSFLWLGALSLAFVVPVYVWRERIYHWLQRLGAPKHPADCPPAEEKQ